jgi:sRNA-binding protein
MIDKWLLQLAHYCRSIGYLRSLTTGAVRVDLDGASGTLTIKEAKSSMTLTLVGSHTSGNFSAAAGTNEAAALAAARLATAARRERAKAKRTSKSRPKPTSTSKSRDAARFRGPGHANPANPSPARRRDKIGCLPCVNPTKSKR